ncbi:recombinase family protein, partial [Phocaeicola dorei]
MNANVIIYYRVSSNEQTLGASLDVQEERLRKYCNQMGYNIIDNIPYREDESAKTFEKRPVIQGIMNYIRKNKSRVNKLLFLQWDRYSRDIISASENLKELLKSGVEPNAIEAPLDFNSDTWPLLLEYRHNATTSKGQKTQWTVFMEHWQKENVLIKHQEGYKNVRISKHETHVEIDTNTAPFIQA